MIWNSKIVPHKGEQRIVIFARDADSIAFIKLKTGAKWSQNLKAWHIPDTDENRKEFGLAMIKNYCP
jgi:integrase/recombinase XerD